MLLVFSRYVQEPLVFVCLPRKCQSQVGCSILNHAIENMVANTINGKWVYTRNVHHVESVLVILCPTMANEILLLLY